MKVRGKVYLTIIELAIQRLEGNIDWEAMLIRTIKEDYPKFVEQLHLTVGCIPNRISPRKKKNMYMTTNALRLKNREPMEEIHPHKIII